MREEAEEAGRRVLKWNDFKQYASYLKDWGLNYNPNNLEETVLLWRLADWKGSGMITFKHWLRLVKKLRKEAQRPELPNYDPVSDSDSDESLGDE